MGTTQATLNSSGNFPCTNELLILHDEHFWSTYKPDPCMLTQLITGTLNKSVNTAPIIGSVLNMWVDFRASR